MNMLRFKISLITTPDINGQYASEVCNLIEEKFAEALSNKPKAKSDVIGIVLLIMPNLKMIDTFSKNSFGRKTVTDLHKNTKLTYFTIPVSFLSEIFSKLSTNNIIEQTLTAVIDFEGSETITKRNYSDLTLLKSAAEEVLKNYDVQNK